MRELRVGERYEGKVREGMWALVGAVGFGRPMGFCVPSCLSACSERGLNLDTR